MEYIIVKKAVNVKGAIAPREGDRVVCYAYDGGDVYCTRDLNRELAFRRNYIHKFESEDQAREFIDENLQSFKALCVVRKFNSFKNRLVF